MHIYKMMRQSITGETRERRRRAMAELIRRESLSSQEELGERLAGLGFAVTQATISRDLEQLGALKVRRAGQTSYALPDQLAAPEPAAHRLAAVFREWVKSVRAAGNLVVITTPPGSAQPVGFALDNASLPEAVGTICGDDTIFIACTSVRRSAALARKLDALRLGEVQ
jgi:transcriptional regulator of arginine metabolism